MTDETKIEQFSSEMLKVGTLLERGKYRIVRHIASGGFGNTYEAVNTSFDAPCAIKEFFMKGVNQRENDSLTVSISNSDMRDAFISSKNKFSKEARRLYTLHNEHIVRVSDLFEENGTVYYAMDLIEGESLSRMMKRHGEPFGETICVNVLCQMLNALECIHKVGLLHMDIKSENILMDASGHCTLIDFGASKQPDLDGLGNTTSTAIAYTPGYAPSEQVNGSKDRWGPWTDIYALGATLYNMLTNKRPPSRDDIDISGSAAFLFPDSVSPSMRQLVEWMMQPVYIRRPQNVGQINDYLMGIAAQSVVSSPASNAVFGNMGGAKVVGPSALKPEATKVYGTGRDTTRIETPQGTIYQGSADSQSFNVHGVQFNMIQVEGGTFMMGATSEQGSDAESDEKPAHSVTLSSFCIGQTLVTQALWHAVMGINPSRFRGHNRPVECVSWDDCQVFLSQLNQMTGLRFRLPTEAEWEFAARGGMKSRGFRYAGSNNPDNVAWFADNSGNETHDVACKRPNELGIYDMSGNVWEWCQDWYGPRYYKDCPFDNPQGQSGGSDRVGRGGSWDVGADSCRSATRGWVTPSYLDNGLGLRLAL